MGSANLFRLVLGEVGSPLAAPRELPVKFSRFRYIGGVRGLGGGVVPKVNAFSILVHIRAIAARCPSRDTLEPAGVVLVQLAICHILGMGRAAQIAPPVVANVAIPVIESATGHFPSHVEPREAVGFV